MVMNCHVQQKVRVGKTVCDEASRANLSSNLLNEVGLSLFRYFKVGLRVCDIVVNKYVRYLIS